MSKSAGAITASKGLYIKLGQSGQWEKECTAAAALGAEINDAGFL